jgi:hypothetical protein
VDEGAIDMTGPAYPPLTAPGGKMVDTMAFKQLRICVMTISDTRKIGRAHV